MVVKVVGKEAIKGVSKRTGKAFDNTLAHVTYTTSSVEGVKTEVIWLPAAEYPLSNIAVGCDYDLDRDNRGFILNFSPRR